MERVRAPYTMGVASNTGAYSWVCTDFALIDELASEMVEEWLAAALPLPLIAAIHVPGWTANHIARAIPSRLWRTIDPEVFRMACYGEWLRRQG